jgi:mycothiol system anti-sigma-R factor
MSCGKPHETDCSEVIEKVYLYLDGEATSSDRAKIKQHLDECAPCLRKYGLEEVVKSMVRRSCGHDPVPLDLRAKVLYRISQVRVEITRYE